MTVRKLEKKDWQAYFDRVSKMLGAKDAEIEVTSLAIGDQIQAKWLPLLGLTYDPRDDIIEVALEGLDHIIARPREIYVEDDTGGLTVVQITTADGAKQFVKLKDPLMLPAPAR